MSKSDSFVDGGSNVVGRRDSAILWCDKKMECANPISHRRLSDRRLGTCRGWGRGMVSLWCTVWCVVMSRYALCCGVWFGLALWWCVDVLMWRVGCVSVEDEIVLLHVFILHKQFVRIVTGDGSWFPSQRHRQRGLGWFVGKAHRRETYLAKIGWKLTKLENNQNSPLRRICFKQWNVPPHLGTRGLRCLLHKTRRT